MVSRARSWIASAVVAPLCALLACSRPPLDVTARAPGPPACPLEGCAGAGLRTEGAHGMRECASAEGSACGSTTPSECERAAMAMWSRAEGEGAIACVARKLDEACSLGEASACAFAGRLWLTGRGVPRDEKHGLEVLVRACDGGVAVACVVGATWLGDPVTARDRPEAIDLRARLEAEHSCLTGDAESCYQVGRLFYMGQNAFPRDASRAVESYERGCRYGAAPACNNLGDALAYGEGAPRDVVRSAAVFEKACRLGEPLGCANLGLMVERGLGASKDRARARELYRQACKGGDLYGCLHVDMVASQDAGAPRDPEAALEYWRRACTTRRDARACAFVGVMYEDGPDGYARDRQKSLDAMDRGCRLGEDRACQWLKEHGG